MESTSIVALTRAAARPGLFIGVALALLVKFLTGAQDSKPALPRPSPFDRRIVSPFGGETVRQPRLAATAMPHEFDEKGSIVLNPDGTVERLHLVGQRVLDVVYVQSGPQGHRRFTPVKVLFRVGIGAAARRGPRIAAFGKNVVVTAPEGGDAKRQGILTVYSTDEGETWSEPRLLTDRPGVAAEAFHDLAVTSEGAFVVVWLDARDGDGQSLYTSRSTDGGKTWSKNARVYRPKDNGVCECCPVTIAGGPWNQVGVVFRNHLGAARDLYMLLSRDGGLTFAEPRKLPGDPWEIAACPMAEGDLTFPPDFGEFQEHAATEWPSYVNNRDGDLFLMMHQPGVQDPLTTPLGRGRRPTLGFDRHFRTTYVAFIDEADHRVWVLRWKLGEKPEWLRRPADWRLGEDETHESPTIASGTGLHLTYEIRTKDQSWVELFCLHSSRLLGEWEPVRR